MTAEVKRVRLPWRVDGARLHLPRDLHCGYIVGRMGLATSLDVWPLLYGSHAAARFGFARLQRLGILRMFPRRSPSELGWYGLTPQAAPWVAETIGCEERELRVQHGIARTNLLAARQRNRLWISLVMSCRAQKDARVVQVRPEWELRRDRLQGTRVVPDIGVVLEDLRHGDACETAWFVELDAGTERLGIWEAKAQAYLDAKRGGTLYEETRWRVLALVPSVRRARTVAGAIVRVSAGSLIWLAVGSELEEGRALEPRLWRADELATDPKRPPCWTLFGVATPISDSDQRFRSAADRGSARGSQGVSR